MFVSTHLISEFEGLIDEFTIIEQGRELLTMDADAARDRFKKIRARFPQELKLHLPGALNVKQIGPRNGNSGQRQQRAIAGRVEIALSRRNCAANRCRWRKFSWPRTFEKSASMNPLVKKEIRLLLPGFLIGWRWRLPTGFLIHHDGLNPTGVGLRLLPLLLLVR